MAGGSHQGGGVRPGLSVSLFDRLTDAHPHAWTASWEELAFRLTLHLPRSRRDGPLWSPAAFAGKRSSRNVASVCCLVLDMDRGSDPNKERWPGLEHVVHSTWRHAREEPRWRAVFPLARTVPGERWREAHAALLKALGAEDADPACKDPSRIYFLPTCPFPMIGEALAFRRKGSWLVPPYLSPAASPPRSTFVPQGPGAYGAVPLDLSSVALGRIADGGKHHALVRAMLKMRLRGYSREACHALVESALRNVGQARMREPIGRALERYGRYVDQTYERFQPDPRRVR